MKKILGDLLACPRCRGPLTETAAGDLLCRTEGWVFPVIDGIPMLLPEQGQPLTPVEGA